MHKKSLLEKAQEEQLALTFNDVRLKTGYSETMPDDVSLLSRFSRNVPLKIPIVSAAMDTVTEHKMAIALAKLGGIGIIHKNMSIEEEAKQVIKVKHHLNGFIKHPVCVGENDTIKSVFAMKEEKGFEFNSFPVINSSGVMVGILTGNDFEFCDDLSSQVQSIMTKDPLSAPEGTSLDDAYQLMLREKKKALPIVDSKGIIAGLYILSDLKRIKTGVAGDYNIDTTGQLYVGASIGAGSEALERAAALVAADVDVLVIDTAHGDSKGVIETLKELKKTFRDVDIVAGNVSVGESAKRLVDAGADGVKVGQGPGSICTTRVIAGIGRPQVSAIYDCMGAIDGSDVPLCADGGLSSSGDIPIAIAAGAESVMMGSMLAGTHEAPGDTIFSQGTQWKSYRGMGSMGAMESHRGSRERYSQSEVGSKSNLVPEGIEGLVPYKGLLSDVMVQYTGGLRRGMGYVGAADIAELRAKGEFERITAAGYAESHPHDVKITKDAPNYKIGK